MSVSRECWYMKPTGDINAQEHFNKVTTVSTQKPDRSTSLNYADIT